MAQGDLIGVEKLPNDDDGNEQFWIVFIDGEKKATQSGYIRETKGPMSETQVREFFATGGQPVADVEEMFRSAREAWWRQDPRVSRLSAELDLPVDRVMPALRALRGLEPVRGDGFGHADGATDDQLIDLALQNIPSIRKGIGQFR